MIVVTGGAGFIGSALIWRLNQRGVDDICIVDRLGESEKWRNCVGLSFREYQHKDRFIEKLEHDRFGDSIDTIIHCGACSSTTERNADYLMENNYRYSVRIARWWERHQNVRFIYASSAATYGDGGQGYEDDELALQRLSPLNMYGYSKHLFDLHAAREGWLSACVGLKYFNVFGPNEYHKGEMRSLINKAYPSVADNGVMRLFKSHRDGYNDGEQMRDFIYVKDAVDMTLFFMEHPQVGGIYNIGTGTARRWNDCAHALFAACGKAVSIEYVPMPETIRKTYQYYTQADLKKLRHAGCRHECMSLEEAIEEYVTAYLNGSRYLTNKI
jgi:ADP-L-glycero-D-manno-heptose 6-epimerase